MSYLDDPRAFWAAERTLLAWIRTQIALLALAILIAKFPHFLGRAADGATTGDRVVIGMICGFAILSAILSSLQFHASIKKMGPQELPSRFAPASLKIVAILNLLTITGVSGGVFVATY